MSRRPTELAENRDRVVQTASTVFRERGPDAPSVGDLMGAAGVTRATFYNHFGSRDDLLAEAISAAFDTNVALMRAIGEAHPERPLTAIADAYLSVGHRDSRGTGCPAAAFASDTARQSEAPRASYAQGLLKLATLLDTFVKEASDEVPEAVPCPDAVRASSAESLGDHSLAALASLVGALTLARDVAQEDPALSQRLLEVARAQVRLLEAGHAA
ncbi:TetR/AcrR family transcriptional regulator [Nocardioides alkalitolerans]|uniref:TetR/AcrR family transcriptional regulator n=1 Tax=Nocardioides alkalitolerans TaxID=281714 RepID=UPI00041D0886|nr:TetR/AcrR family transcriptional regulator [Nocardioides alkalitolerans]